MLPAGVVTEGVGDRLLPYIPRPVLEWVATEPEARHKAVEGTLTFLDISGFTKLSEGLARRGKVGAEQVAETISFTFSNLLAMAQRNGGTLLKFGGDALLLLYSGPHHEQRACLAAAEMRAALRQIGKFEIPGGRINLRMSVGVNSGVFDFFLVGQSHRELLIVGPEVTTTVRMESAASAGQILMSPTTAAGLSGRMTSEGPGGGRFLRRAPSSVPTTDLTEATSPQLSDEQLLRCVPISLREMLLTTEPQPEHRRATPAFVHFDGIDELMEREGPERMAEMLEEFVTVVQEATERHEVTFLYSDIDADGGKILLVAGAPSARGDDEERMLRALRRILDANTAIPVRIGTNRGNIFVGDVGPRFARTFTVMGDAINLAARVMAKAEPGTLMATPAVIDRSNAVFDLTAVEPFMVKGKSEPVQAYVIGDVVADNASSETKAALPLIGRTGELDRLRTAFDTARAGHGQLLEIVGDVGVGKTRLLDELRRHAASHGETVELASHCQPYESASPYAAIRGPLQALFGVPPEESAHVRAGALERALRTADPSLMPWAPLIAPVVEAELPETPETAALDAKFRAERLGWVVSAYVVAAPRPPTVLTIEDTHWMDEASAGVLGSLATAAKEASLLICTTRRPEEGGYQADPEQSLALRPLDERDATHLIQTVTDMKPLAPHVTAEVVRRAGGNPLYLTELLAAVTGREVESLPDTVEALITSRIDRLPHDDRRMLREASVLGQKFPTAWLEVLLGRPAAAVLSRLGQFLHSSADGTVSFQHALVREAAYEGLPFRARRQLHADVAELITKSVEGASEGTDDQAGLLSLHYFSAERFDQAWEWSLVAARRDQALYANPEAAEMYERAIQAARRLHDLEETRIADVHESLGDVQYSLGAYQPAEASYRTAARLLKSDPTARARLNYKIGHEQQYAGRYPQALRTLNGGLRLLGEDGSVEAARVRARLMAAYANCCEMKGDHRRTILWSRRAIEVAEGVGEKEALANGLRMLDLARSEIGELGEPVNLERAVQLYDELGDLSGKGRALNVLAAVRYWRGEWDRALELYEASRAATLQSGNLVFSAVTAANIAEVLLDQGRLEGLGALLAESSRVINAAGMAAGVAFVKYLESRLALLEERFEEAILRFDAAIDEAESTQSMHELLYSRTGKAEALVASGRVDAAHDLASETLELAKGLGGAPDTPRLYRVRAVCHALNRDRDGAEKDFEASLQDARARSADYEIALTLAARAGMSRALEAPVISDLQSEATFRRLGVISVLDLYGSLSRS
jgi:class 3 adenylate cyclase/predicted ATPase